MQLEEERSLPSPGRLEWMVIYGSKFSSGTHTGRKIMRRVKGFTLIELLVVVAIIAILIAIIVPVVGKAKQKARTVQCAANLHSIVPALLVYAEVYRQPTDW